MLHQIPLSKTQKDMPDLPPRSPWAETQYKEPVKTCAVPTPRLARSLDPITGRIQGHALKFPPSGLQPDSSRASDDCKLLTVGVRGRSFFLETRNRLSWHWSSTASLHIQPS